MNRNWKAIENFLIYLLVFLLPSQLALHFWPSNAFIFGIRVDYLSPAIYLTDVLFGLLFLSWLRCSWSHVLIFINKHRTAILTVIFLIFLNTTFSVAPLISLFRWGKVVEFAAFALYVYSRSDIFATKIFYKVLFCSLVIFSLIGIFQFILGRTIGGSLFLLGERSFSLSTPGIALVDIAGKSFMRAYSTFSHPNSMAGFLGAGIFIFLFGIQNKELRKKGWGILIILLGMFLTFSLSTFISFIICVALYLLIKKRWLNNKQMFFLPAILVSISLLFVFVSDRLIQNKNVFTKDIGERIELTIDAGRSISRNFLIGSGINTFIINQSNVGNVNHYFWLLQPVHNIYLLVFSETGIFGLLLFLLLLTRIINKSFVLQNKYLLLSLVFVLVTGLLDHYWLTLQQNSLFFALIIGKSFAARN